jgi:hypothetical protein
MAFNAEQFRKEATDAGYSPEEIDAVIAKQSGGTPNTGPAANQGMMAEVMSRLPEGAQTLPQDAKTMLGAGLGLTALGGAYGLYQAYQAHQDRALDREIKQLQVLEAKQRLGLAPPPATTPAAAAPPAVDFSLTGGRATPEQMAAFDQQFRAGTGQAPAAPATAPAEPTRVERAAARIQEGQARGLGAQPAGAVAPAAPDLLNVPNMPPELVRNPNPTSAWDTYIPASALPPEAPQTAAAIATNQPGSAVADAVVRDELVKPIAPSATPEPAIAGEAGAAVTPKRGRRTNAEKAAEAAAAPAGFKPQYKKPPEGMGPGAFNHLANNVGVEEATRIWEATYGKKNVPYSQFMQDYSSAAGKNMIGPVQPLPAGAKPGGSFGTPKYIPEYIAGRAKPSGLLGLGAMAAALGLAGSEEGQKAMARAAGAIKDIGVSPDIFQGKGEELGRLGRGYVTAGNPAYLRELSAQLQTETDPQRRAVLLEEFQKAGGSGAGRGIAPPVR